MSGERLRRDPDFALIFVGSIFADFVIKWYRPHAIFPNIPRENYDA